MTQDERDARWARRVREEYKSLMASGHLSGDEYTPILTRGQVAPSWLTPAQREGWDYAIEHSSPRLLWRLDRSLLTIWVVAKDLHRQAAQKVAEYGMLTNSDGGPTVCHYLHIVNKQSVIVTKAAALLGIGPASRAGLVGALDRSDNAFSNNGRRGSVDVLRG
jgi:phage terminase small subunit